MCLLNQVAVAQASEELVDQLIAGEDSNSSKVSQLAADTKLLVDRAGSLLEEKAQLTRSLDELKQEHDALKAKFSALLDNF